MFKFIRSTILAKLGILFCLMTLLTMASIFYTVHTFRVLKGVSRAVDVSGSERMRSILLGFLVREYAEEVQKGGGKPTIRAAKLKSLIKEELGTYGDYLNGFLLGNEALGLIKVENELLVDQLEILNQEFLEWKKSIKWAIRPGATEADLERTISRLSVENAIHLKQTAHKVVQLFESLFRENVQKFKGLQKIILASSVALFFFTVWLIYVVVRPIKDVVRATNRMAEGDLTQRLEIDLQDEIGMLGNAINHTILEWGKVLKQLIQSSGNLTESSSHISLAISEIAKGAGEQVEQVIKTSEAMEEMSNSIQDISRNARTTTDYADTATFKLQQGKAACKETVHTIHKANRKMDELNERSVEIGKIVHFINDFAEQTNLLAINAAIEAERAGVHGKGFDVVADEIRKMARKTSQFTSEIVSVLEGLQQGVMEVTKIMNDGTCLVEDTSNFLIGITKDISKTADRISLISTATARQVDISGKIADSLFFISGVSRETSTNSLESAEETRKLADLAQELKTITTRFSSGW